MLKNSTATATAVMTINKVLDKHLQATYTCSGSNAFLTVSRNVTLRQKGEGPSPCPLLVSESVPLSTFFPFLLSEFSYSSIIQKVATWLACLLFILLLKFFSIDIALLFRPCVTLINHKKGEGKLGISPSALENKWVFVQQIV